MKLNIKAFAIAGGVISAVFALIFHIFVLLTGIGAEFLAMIVVWHPGASVSYLGAAIHAFWMFVYGFIGSWFFAWLYNKQIKEVN